MSPGRFCATSALVASGSKSHARPFRLEKLAFVSGGAWPLRAAPSGRLLASAGEADLHAPQPRTSRAHRARHGPTPRWKIPGVAEKSTVTTSLSPPLLVDVGGWSPGMSLAPFASRHPWNNGPSAGVAADLDDFGDCVCPRQPDQSEFDSSGTIRPRSGRAARVCEPSRAIGPCWR